jgi:hypothetical protein
MPGVSAQADPRENPQEVVRDPAHDSGQNYLFTEKKNQHGRSYGSLVGPGLLCCRPGQTSDPVNGLIGG